MKLAIKFIQAVQNLDRAFADVEEVWDDDHDDVIELSHTYPFQRSISEMQTIVNIWRYAIETHNVLEDSKPMPFEEAFCLYEQDEEIIESVVSGRTFKKEWTDPVFTLDVRTSQSFDPEEIRHPWIIHRV